MRHVSLTRPNSWLAVRHLPKEAICGRSKARLALPSKPDGAVAQTGNPTQAFQATAARFTALPGRVQGV